MAKFFFVAFVFILMATSCNSPSPSSHENDIAKELLDFIKSQNDQLKTENEELKKENDLQKDEIVALKKEIGDLKNMQPRIVKVINPKREKPMLASKVHLFDLVGQWKARISFLERTDTKCGNPGDVITQDWDITLTSEGLVIRTPKELYKGVLSDNNKLVFDKDIPYSPFLIQSQNEMLGRQIDKIGRCTVTYEVILTKKR